MKRQKKILFASSEVVPFAKTGGLADVVGSLPRVLEKLSADVSVVMPKYKIIDEKTYKMKKVTENFSVSLGSEMVEVCVKTSKIPNSKSNIYFIECDKYFNRDEIYGDYSDNDQRFALFAKAVIEMLKVLDYKPDVIHCNDWQTGLIPTYLKVNYKDDDFYKGIATIMTIHNIAYQGIFPSSTMEKIGLPWDVFNPSGVEYWGNISYLKAGLVYADIISTVSETYAKEIQASNEFGKGMEGILTSRHNDLFGILNGIDYEVWNPSKDDLVKSNYDESDLRGKSRCKKALQKELGLKAENTPIIGVVSRLIDYKGFDLIAAAMPRMINMDLQMVILGFGEEHYHNMLRQLSEEFQGKVSSTVGFDDELAHKIYSSCDLFLMPSRFEPCGLSQMIALKYGALPVVYKTGGLADTITDYTAYPDEGNGFVFDEYTPEAMLDAMDRAMALYSNKRKWNSIVKRSMAEDYSWKKSAFKYMELYAKAIEKVAVPA